MVQAKNINILDWFEKEAHDVHLSILKKQVDIKQNALSPELQNQLTAHFGFKNTQALMNFLKSPGGKAMQSLIKRKLAELQALIEESQQTAVAQQKARALFMLLLGLAYKEEAAAEHRQHIYMQEYVDKQLDHKTASSDIYTESAEALNEALAKQELDIDALHAEWDALDEETDLHATEDLFERLSDSDDADSHFKAMQIPQLKLVREENKAVHKNGKIYLIPKHVLLHELSLEAQENAHHAFRNLPTPLMNAMDAKCRQETKKIEQKKDELIKKSIPVHQDINALTRQLTLVHQAIDKLKNQKKTVHADQATLAKSYKLLAREAKHTTTKKQNKPILRAVRNDLEVNPDRINEMGGPQWGEWLHKFERGTVKTANHQHQRQTVMSLLREMNAYFKKAATAEVSRKEQERLNPKPEPVEKPKFHPTPFNKKPF